MKVLLVKTSSMGDVVHTLTALREAKIQRPELQIDWLVEESFGDIAQIAVQQGDIANIIPIHFRQWRKRKPFGVFFNPDILALKQTLVNNHYHLVLDAQGLIKSAFLANLAGVPIAGMNKHSARESIATYFYQYRYAVDKNQHAIARLRQLFAQVFDYSLLEQAPTFLSSQFTSKTGQSTAAQSADSRLMDNQERLKQILLFHGTTWDNKCYPTAQWRDLASQLGQRGYHVLIPRHGDSEYRVASTIEDGIDNVSVLPEQRLNDLLATLTTADAVISVDTGLAHLAVYLGIPTVMLFGPTRPDLTGGIGSHTLNLVGQAEDTATMKRETYPREHFSNSMQAIAVNEIMTALESLTN